MALKIAIKTVLDESRQTLEWIVEELQEQFGHSESVAIDLLERFYRRFPAREFRELYPQVISVRDDVFRMEIDFIAYRIQYFEALGHPLDEEAFFEFYYVLSQDYDHDSWARKARRVAKLREQDRCVAGWELRMVTNWCLVARHYDMRQKTNYGFELPLSVDLSNVKLKRKMDDGAVNMTIRLALD